jgi:hypothetical protein
MARRGKKPGSRKTGGRKRGTPLNVIARADVGMKPVASGSTKIRKLSCLIS